MRRFLLVIIIAVSLIGIGVMVLPRSTEATVPVHVTDIPLPVDCVGAPCEVWDRALSGPRPASPSTVAGLPTTGTFAVDRDAWSLCKDRGHNLCATKVLTNPQDLLSRVASVFSDDAIAWLLARQVLHIFTQEMVSWIRTGQAGGGPLFTTDLVGELFNAADNAAGHFLAQYASEEWYQLLCSPFRPHIYLALGRGRIPYIERARCTVTDIVDKLENFYTNFSNGGWAAWFSTIEPQNNPYGLYLLSLEEKEQREREVTFDIRHNFLAGQGFIGLKKCKEGAMLDANDPQNPTKGKPYCTKYETTTPGKVVESQLSKSLSMDLEKLGVADELNEIIAVVFDELLSWLISGGSGGDGLLYTDLPDPEPIADTCTDDTGRHDGCFCEFPGEQTSQCASNYCSAQSVCELLPVATTQCDDLIDNDNDGFIDYPVDPQCTSPEDASESEEIVAPPQELVIVSTSPLPDAPLGLSTWSYQFLAEGGTQPYIWSAVDTGMNPIPSGLFLSESGLLAGTPLSPGTWTFTVSVTDSVASSTQSMFIVTVQ